MEIVTNLDCLAVRHLKSLARPGGRLDYNISQAIRGSLIDIQGKLRANYGKVFKIRRQAFWDRSVKITSWPKPKSLVGTVDAVFPQNSALAGDALEDQESGGTREPLNRRGIFAVPSRRASSFGQTVVIRSNPLSPGNLSLQETHGGVAEGKRNTLVLPIGGSKGISVILQRISKARAKKGMSTNSGFRILFTVVKRVKLKARLGWGQTVKSWWSGDGIKWIEKGVNVALLPRED